MSHAAPPPSTLFDKVVALCGVSAVLAPGMVRRALLDGKVQVDAATPADYRAALPRILARLRAYMPEEEAQKRARKIGALLGAVEAGKSIDSEDESDWSLIGRVTEALRSGTPEAGVSRLPDFDVDEVTKMGRRYTRDEIESLRKSGVHARDDAAGVAPSTGEIDLRKTKQR